MNENVNISNEAIGIDLGTRFSCVSIWKNKKLEIIPDNFGNRTIPSIVSFYKSARLIGHNALSIKDINPSNTIYDIKRIIGRKYDDPIIDYFKKIISYDIIEDTNNQNNILIQLDKKDNNLNNKILYKPEEICSYILMEIKKMANKYLNENINKCIITVPAYFNDNQRQATLDSAKIAGFEVLKIINEPTAAALAYGMGNKKWNNKTNGNVIVYDFGAGTLDVSLINIDNGIFRTLSVGGNTHLGGEDIDYLLMNYIITKFKNENNLKELNITKIAQLKLKNSVENAKKILSSFDKTFVCVENFYKDLKLYQTITREELELVCNEIFIMCIKPLSDVLESAFMSKNDIDDIILVGGSSKIPKIQKLILDFFKNTEIKTLNMSLNPDEVVSAGASIYSYILTHKEDPFSDNLILLDIVPLSLGVETLQKKMTVIIPRNTVIPTKKTKIFSTDTDNQDSVLIKIFEGERKLSKDNYHLGTFELSGIPKGPRGYPKIKITFNIDINGILEVSAYEKNNNIHNSIKISSMCSSKGRISKKEIDEIIKEAQKYEQIDNIYTIKLTLIHNIKNMINSIEYNILDENNNLTNKDKKKINIDIKKINKILNKNICDLEINELEELKERIKKNYYFLIVINNNKNLEHYQKKNVGTNINDDDENNTIYESIKFNNNTYNYEDINSFKKIISDLSNNILNVINNPISKFEKNDIEIMTDYINTIQLWLYTTSSNNINDYIIKIDEINKYTEEFMKKYQNKKIFHKNDNFSIKDELYITCITLNNSIKSNYFSAKESDMNKLSKILSETLEWLKNNQNEEKTVYQNKIDTITNLCNDIYNNMCTIKEIENIEEEEEDLNIINQKNNENIERLINSLPEKLNKNNNDDILLKIDINKLTSNLSIKYKNI